MPTSHGQTSALRSATGAGLSMPVGDGSTGAGVAVGTGVDDFDCCVSGGGGVALGCAASLCVCGLAFLTSSIWTATIERPSRVENKLSSSRIVGRYFSMNARNGVEVLSMLRCPGYLEIYLSRSQNGEPLFNIININSSLYGESGSLETACANHPSILGSSKQTAARSNRLDSMEAAA